jgi:hypothetical protein
MATSRYWVEDILTGIVLTQDLPLNDVTVDDALNRPGSLQGTIPVDHPMATEEILDEGRRAIYWERDGKIEWGGILWEAPRPLGSREIRVQCEGWLGYWDHRDIWRDRQFTNTEQFTIFQTLIADAQDEAYSTALGGPGASSDLGITVTWDTASGVTRDRLDDYRTWKATNLGEALRRLAGVGSGFDYGMVYSLDLGTDRITKQIKLWHPTRGRDTGYLFEFDGPQERPTGDAYPSTYTPTYTGGSARRPGQTNITRWGVNRSARNMAWRAKGWGNGYDADRLSSTQITEAMRGVYPPLDASFSEFSSVEQQSTLDENTLAALSRRDHPTRLPLIEIDPGKFPRWGDWELGDTVGLRIDDGYGSLGIDVPADVRILGWSVRPKDDRPVLTLEVA